MPMCSSALIPETSNSLRSQSSKCSGHGGGLQRSLACLCPGNGQNKAVVDEEMYLTTLHGPDKTQHQTHNNSFLGPASGTSPLGPLNSQDIPGGTSIRVQKLWTMLVPAG